VLGCVFLIFVIYCFGCGCCWFVVSLFEFLAFTSSSASSLPAAAPAAKGGCAEAAVRRGARVMSFMVF